MTMAEAVEELNATVNNVGAKYKKICMLVLRQLDTLNVWSILQWRIPVLRLRAPEEQKSVHDLMKALSLLQILSKDRERVAIELCSRSSIAVHRVSERLKLLSLFRGPQLCDPSVERPAIELGSRSLSSWEKVSERPQQLAVPNASLAVPSATQTTDSVDSRGLSLLTPRGSVVVMYRRSTLHDEDLGEVVGLSGHGTWVDEDLHEIFHYLVENHMATIESVVLESSQECVGAAGRQLPC